MTFDPAGPLVRFVDGVPGTDFPDLHINDLVLCSPSLAFIHYRRPGGDIYDDLYSLDAVNPSTGELLAQLDSSPMAVPFLGQMQPLDSETACFAVDRDVDFVFGTVTVSGVSAHYHTFDQPPEHVKDTGFSVWVDPASRQGVAIYYPDYRFDYIGGHWVTSARAIVFDFDTHTSHEFDVVPNTGNPSPEPSVLYYGTLALPDGRAYGCRGSDDGAAQLLFDNTNTEVDRVTLTQMGLNPDDYFVSGGWLYQLGNTEGFVIIFGVDGLEDHWWYQRYSTAGGQLARVDAPIRGSKLSGSWSSLSWGDRLGEGIVDQGDIAAAGYRILNLPFFNNANNADDALSFYVGVDSWSSGSTQVGVLRVPDAQHAPADEGSFTVDTNANSVTVGSNLFVLYAFIWPDYYDPVLDQRIYSHVARYQLWRAGGVGPALRLLQRDDGLGIAGAPPRLLVANMPTSRQLGGAPRVGNTNTYS